MTWRGYIIYHPALTSTWQTLCMYVYMHVCMHMYVCVHFYVYMYVCIMQVYIFFTKVLVSYKISGVRELSPLIFAVHSIYNPYTSYLWVPAQLTVTVSLSVYLFVLLSPISMRSQVPGIRDAHPTPTPNSTKLDNWTTVSQSHSFLQTFGSRIEEIQPVLYMTGLGMGMGMLSEQ